MDIFSTIELDVSPTVFDDSKIVFRGYEFLVSVRQGNLVCCSKLVYIEDRTKLRFDFNLQNYESVVLSIRYNSKDFFYLSRYPLQILLITLDELFSLPYLPYVNRIYKDDTVIYINNDTFYDGDRMEYSFQIPFCVKRFTS